MPEVITPTEIAPLVLKMRPAIEMTDELFAEFCQIDSDLRIELTAEGELVIMLLGWSIDLQQRQICIYRPNLPVEILNR
jgi:Uma2 family endonuclease